MVSESLAHRELKRDAKIKLKEMGFKDSEIIEEYRVNGYPRGYEIDIVGISQTKKVAIEVGHLDKLKKAVLKREMGRIDVPFDEVIHIPYSETILPSELYEEDSESLPEEKRFMIAVYNEQVYDKLKNDKEFEFKKCSGVNDPLFKIGRFNAWMSIPTERNAWGEILQYEINFGIHHKEGNSFGVTINAETNKAVKIFLEQMYLEDNKTKILDLFHKLPDAFLIHAAYKYKDKGHRLFPLPRNWEDSSPHQCNMLTMEQLDEIIEYLEFYLEYGSKVEQYAIISIVTTEVRKDDMSSVFKLLKDLYNLLFNMDTLDLRTAKKISQIPSFEWYVDERKYDMLLEEVQEQFTDIDKSRLKKLIRLLRSKEE